MRCLLEEGCGQRAEEELTWPEEARAIASVASRVWSLGQQQPHSLEEQILRPHFRHIRSDTLELGQESV